MHFDYIICFKICKTHSVSERLYKLRRRSKGKVAMFRICKRVYSTSRAFDEVKIPVPWGHVAGKWWYPRNNRPILTLHGWQDNCGSFNRLIPLLDDEVGFLAIDLPGHGHSSKIPAGMHYHNINYPILIRYIKNYFNWPKVSLMGHSLGGISCYVYTMIFPNSVDFLITIDGVKPLQKQDNFPRMAIGFDEILKYDELMRKTKPPSYELDSLKEKMAASNNNSIDIEHVEHILMRNLEVSDENPEKYVFRRDPRLKSRLILNWDQNELIENAKRVKCPMMVLKASESGYFEKRENMEQVKEQLEKFNPNFHYHYVKGKHHLHLNDPESVSGFINDFLSKYKNNKQ